MPIAQSGISRFVDGILHPGHVSMIRTDATVCSSAAAGAAADMRARDIRSCTEANTFCKLVPGFPSSTESSKLQRPIGEP